MVKTVFYHLIKKRKHEILVEKIIKRIFESSHVSLGNFFREYLIQTQARDSESKVIRLLWMHRSLIAHLRTRRFFQNKQRLEGGDATLCNKTARRKIFWARKAKNKLKDEKTVPSCKHTMFSSLLRRVEVRGWIIIITSITKRSPSKNQRFPSMRTSRFDKFSHERR